MKVFIADYLPLANKGEEEIIRGIEALFRKKGDEKTGLCLWRGRCLESLKRRAIYIGDMTE